MADAAAFCGAARRHDAGTCKAPAGRGTDHLGYGRCSWHGGCAPNVVRAAARQKADAEAREVLAQLNVRPVGNPLAALRLLGGQVLAWQAACARLVNKLTDEQVRYEGNLHGEMLRAEVGMYQDALRQSAQVLASIAKLDVDDRLAMIEQRKADQVAAAFATAIARAALPTELERSVRSEFVGGLRVLVDQEDEDGTLTGVVIPPSRALR